MMSGDGGYYCHLTAFFDVYQAAGFTDLEADNMICEFHVRTGK